MKPNSRKPVTHKKKTSVASDSPQAHGDLPFQNMPISEPGPSYAQGDGQDEASTNLMMRSSLGSSQVITPHRLTNQQPFGQQSSAKFADTIPLKDSRASYSKQLVMVSNTAMLNNPSQTAVGVENPMGTNSTPGNPPTLPGLDMPLVPGTSGMAEMMQAQAVAARIEDQSLVPNFRSISPSIFNINLKQGETTSTRAQGNGLSSPSNQIYVSIHSKRNEGAQVNNATQSRIKRITRIRRHKKSDKIKFGVLFTRDQQNAQKRQPIERIKFEDPKQLAIQSKAEIGRHSDQINSILGKYQTYATTRTIPSSIMSHHTNLVRHFKQNFTRETQAYAKSLQMAESSPGRHTTAAGYFSEGAGAHSPLQAKFQSYANRSSFFRSLNQTYDFGSDPRITNLRDVIEQHARSVAAANKQFKTNIHLEIDERRKERQLYLMQKGKQIAQKMKLSPKSCCPKLYRSLTAEQPIRQHNKPLTYLMRQSQKDMVERKHQAEENKRQAEQEWKAKLKASLSAYSVKNLKLRFMNMDRQGAMSERKPFSHINRDNMTLSPRKRQIKEWRGQTDKLQGFVAKGPKRGGSLSVRNANSMAPRSEQIALSYEKKQACADRNPFVKQRKEWERQIDNGMTFSHLSKYYSIKREWRQEMTMVADRNKERLKHNRKIKKVIKEFKENGVTDEAIINDEIARIEFLGFKKKQQEQQKRLGGKEHGGYFFPIDTSRTIKLEKVSLAFSEDDYDGPGGFQESDFLGVETNFSKQSLEQRKIRVNKARERLRAKNEARIKERRREREEGRAREDDPAQSALGIHEKSSELLVRDDYRNELSMQEQEHEETMPDVEALDQVDPRKYARRPPVARDTKVVQSNMMVHVPTIIESATNEGSIVSEGDRFPDKTQSGEVLSQERRSSRIRVEIASTSLKQAKRGDTKPNSRHNEYSLEDGGIFEKKTLAANTSVEVEEVKVVDGLTPNTVRSYEQLKALKSQTSEQQDMSQAQSHRDKIKIAEMHGYMHQISSRKIEIDHEPSHQNKVSQELQDTQLMEDEEIVHRESMEVLPQVDSIPITLTHSGRNRPSTTENIRTIIKKQQRKIMSGQAQKFNNLRPSQSNNFALARYQDTSGPIGIQGRPQGYITQLQLVHPVPKTLLNQDSSGGNQLLEQRAQAATSGFITTNDARYMSQGQLQSSSKDRSGARRAQLATAANSTAINEVMDAFERSKSRSVSQLTLTRTGESVEGSGNVTIWKEIMRLKESEGLQGHQRLTKSMIKTVRSRIRRERIRFRKQSKKRMLRKMTSMGFPDRSQIDMQRARSQLDRNSSTAMDMQRSPNQTQQFAAAGLLPEVQQKQPLNEKTPSQGQIPTSAVVDVQQYTTQRRNEQQVQPHLDLSSIQAQMQHHIQKQHHGQPQQLGQNILHDGNLRSGNLTSYMASRPQLGQYSPPRTHDATTTDYDQQYGTTTIVESTPVTAQAGSNTIMVQDGVPALDPPNFLSQSRPAVRTADGHRGGRGPNGFILSVPDGVRLDGALLNDLTDSDENMFRKDFIELNRSYVTENAFKQHHLSHISRLRQMRQHRRPDSIYQARFSENQTRSALNFNQKNIMGLKQQLKNAPLSLQRLKTSATMLARTGQRPKPSMSPQRLTKSFKDMINDRRSLKVFQKNEINVDPDIQNYFSRQQSWNQTLNCPYYGLMSLRKTQERPINSTYRDENILRPFTLGNKQDRSHITQIRSAVSRRNQIRDVDRQIYGLIDDCAKTNKIEWRSIYKDNEAFRNQQRKRMKPEAALSVDDYLELQKI